MQTDNATLKESQKAILFQLINSVGGNIPWNSFNIEFYAQNTGFSVDQVNEIVREWVETGRVFIRHYPGHIHVEVNPQDWRYNG